MSDDQEENAHLPRRARQRLTLSANPPAPFIASLGSSTKTFVQSTVTPRAVHQERPGRADLKQRRTLVTGGYRAVTPEC